MLLVACVRLIVQWCLTESLCRGFHMNNHVLLPCDRAPRRAQRLLALVCLWLCFVAAAAVPCADGGGRGVAVVVCLAGSCVCVLLTRCFCCVVDLFFRGPCTFELPVSFSISCVFYPLLRLQTVSCVVGCLLH